MNKEQAFDIIEQFANNLLEYVENIAGNDYGGRKEAITEIAGDEDEFWKAVNFLQGKR